MFLGYDEHNYKKDDDLNFEKCLCEYCYECSVNVENALSAYSKGSKRCQDMEKWINFPKYLRSNENKFISYLKYLTRSCEVTLVRDKIFVEGAQQREDVQNTWQKFTENFTEREVKLELEGQ